MKIQRETEEIEHYKHDEIYAPFYTCIKCNTKRALTPEYKFCPMCGENIEWIKSDG